jgi:hypothetical protein
VALCAEIRGIAGIAGILERRQSINAQDGPIARILARISARRCAEAQRRAILNDVRTVLGELTRGYGGHFKILGRLAAWERAS